VRCIFEEMLDFENCVFLAQFCAYMRGNALRCLLKTGYKLFVSLLPQIALFATITCRSHLSFLPDCSRNFSKGALPSLHTWPLFIKSAMCVVNLLGPGPLYPEATLCATFLVSRMHKSQAHDTENLDTGTASENTENKDDAHCVKT